MTTVSRRLGDLAVTTTGGHRLHAYASEHGYIGSCACGWRCCRADRATRDADVARHLHPTERTRP